VVAILEHFEDPDKVKKSKCDFKNSLTNLNCQRPLALYKYFIIIPVETTTTIIVNCVYLTNKEKDFQVFEKIDNPSCQKVKVSDREFSTREPARKSENRRRGL
jgi:hypothetical protein